MQSRINFSRKLYVMSKKTFVFAIVTVLFSFIIYAKYYCKTTVFEMKAELIEQRTDLEFVDAMFRNDYERVSSVEPLKYILQWTSPTNIPFAYMGKGQQGFIDRNCTYTNCFVTADRAYLRDFTEFDVIVFNGPEISIGFRRVVKKLLLPERRSPHQKYAFASIESGEHYPICNEELDDYFNWTWTYKLDSDSRWGYFVIKDANGKVVGPKAKMDWLKSDEMMPVPKELRNILDGKKKAVAWFVSSCLFGRRESFAKRLDKALDKYGLSLDVYGKCGDLKCDRSNEKECDEMLGKDYLFYLAFENALSEDYVTEKLLRAMKHMTLPVVFSGADLTRFVPPGSYLDARALGAQRLAAKMNELARDSDKYADYFKWTNHYSYHSKSESPETDDYCGFCALLNDEKIVKNKTVYKEFRKWWTPDYMC